MKASSHLYAKLLILGLGFCLVACNTTENQDDNGAKDDEEVELDEEDNENSAGTGLGVSVDSLLAEFNGMNEAGDYYYTEDKWVIHDPSKMVEVDGYLMIGVTGKAQEDGYDCGLETWYMVPGEDTFRPGQCLLQDKPAWIGEEVPTNDGAYWAPGLLDARTIYYSVPSGGAMEEAEGAVSCIGMLTATGEAPNLIWTDAGAPITCTLQGEVNTAQPEPSSIDAATFVDDDGTTYLLYGGGHIWSTKLGTNGRQVEDDWWENDASTYYHLANGPSVTPEGEPAEEDEWIEAPYMYKKGEYYYLFVNWYACCGGADSTYEIHVGRSLSPTGPFVDDAGIDLRQGGGKLLIDRSAGYIGPGHPAVFSYTSMLDGSDKEILTFHHYPEDGTPWATIGSQVLTWIDGWPTVSGQTFDTMDYWGE